MFPSPYQIFCLTLNPMWWKWMPICDGNRESRLNKVKRKILEIGLTDAWNRSLCRYPVSDDEGGSCGFWEEFMIEPPSSFLAMQYWYGRYANTILVKMLHCSYIRPNSSILPAAARGQNTSLFMTHAHRSLRFCGGFLLPVHLLKKSDGRMRSLNTTAHRPSENTLKTEVS